MVEIEEQQIKQQPELTHPIMPIIEKINSNKTICLTMIVLNEIQILKRTFDSVVEYIDYWVICDTGSDDGTKEFILAYFKKKGIPGKLVEKDWVNFGYNRSYLMSEARGCADYLLLMDADFVFKIGEDKNFKNKLNLDAYYIKYEGGLDYQQLLFVNGVFDWVYKGVTHEYITCDNQKFNHGKTDFFTFLHESDGANKVNKVQRDIALLKQGLIDEPDNSRYHFYLAQSYMEQKEYELARTHYQLRVDAGGWKEEMYYAKFQIGMSYLIENQEDEKSDIGGDKHSGSLIIEKLVDAYNFRNSRLEALFYAVKYCRVNKFYNTGFLIGISAVNNSYPSNDVLFISKKIHNYEFLNELAICAFFSNKYEEATLINKKLVEENRIPEELVESITNNINVCAQKLQSSNLTDDPVVKSRIDMINLKLNNNLYETIILNSHLLNNNENFDKVVFINVNGDNFFELQKTIQSLELFIENDSHKIKKSDIFFMILDNGKNKEQTEFLKTFFQNIPYSTFRAILKNENIDYGLACGLNTLKELNCKNIYYANQGSENIFENFFTINEFDKKVEEFNLTDKIETVLLNKKKTL